MERFDVSRCTQGAQRAIAEAQAEALSKGRRCVMPIDLLVGLLMDEQKSSAARRALSALGMEVQEVRQKLNRLAAGAARPMGGNPKAAPSPLHATTTTVFGTDSNRVFAGATELAQANGAHRIGTEHLLLALYDDSFAPLVRVIMQDFGIKDSGDKRRARDMIVEALAEAVSNRPV